MREPAAKSLRDSETMVGKPSARKSKAVRALLKKNSDENLRPLNPKINGGLGSPVFAGERFLLPNGLQGIYANVSMTNGNTNHPNLAFPSLIAKSNGITLKKTI